MTYVDLETINPLTSKIIGCGVEVHRRLGPGLLESVYHACLVWELRTVGFTVLENTKVPIGTGAINSMRRSCSIV
jgi:GxxExxY protein